MIWNLPHLVIEYPLWKFTREPLFRDHIQHFFHVADLFRADLGSVVAKHDDRNLARVTIEYGEPERVMEFRVPLGIVSQLTQIAWALGHSRILPPCRVPDCARCVSAP